MKDVVALHKKPRSPGNDYRTAPLLVLNNMPVESSHGKLLCSMFQNMFPAINTAKVKLSEVRRVVLFDYSCDTDTIAFRHFAIHVKPMGVCKSVKRIIRSEIPDLSNFADAAEYVLKAEANLSESEVEPDSLLALGQEDHVGAGNNSKSQPKSINLVEYGPRMTLKLIKIMEGLDTGKVLYHAPAADEAKDGDKNMEISDRQDHRDTDDSSNGSVSQ